MFPASLTRKYNGSCTTARPCRSTLSIRRRFTLLRTCFDVLFHRNVRVAISLVGPGQDPAAGQGRALQHLSPRLQRMQVSRDFRC